MAMPAMREEQPEAEAQETRDPEKVRTALSALVGKLESETTKRVGQRREIEKRWIEDLRAYEGEYDAKTFRELDDAKKSTLFINKTRAKTNACEARLSDMLFPTDDKNWGIGPTPVPEMAEKARDSEAAVRQAEAAANDMAARGDLVQAQAIADQGSEAAEVGAQMEATNKEADKRARAMEAEMEDQLTECSYNIVARDAIRDGCKVGTGIIKGPILKERTRRSWKQTQGNVYALNQSDDPRPAYRRVDYWDFFPDMDARNYGEGEGDFERHLMTKTDLRRLARQDGFDEDAIRTLLKQEPRDILPTYLQELRSITGAYDQSVKSKYHVWEYNGPLEADDFRTLCECFGEHELLKEQGELDPLMEIHAVVWFCQGIAIFFAMHPMDSDETLYSLFNLEKDDAGPFGFGIPYVMRHPQKSLNGAWRMMMDNSGLSSGPQIEIDLAVLEPEDGSYDIYPRKIWRRAKNAPDRPGMIVHEISSHQAELANIIALSDQFVDDVTNMPVMAQGEQGTHTTQTLGGMSILMNSVNVVFRRIVKNWDDDVTIPVIRRLYDWNMQHSAKEHIKGDFEVDARGTSVLLVREIQSQNLMAMAMNFSAHPVLGSLTKVAPLYRKLVQSFMLSADEIVMTEDEIKKAQAEAEANGPPPDIDMMKLEAQRQIAEMELNGKLQIAQMERDLAMIRLSTEQNISIAQIQAQLSDKQADRDSAERKFAAEAAITKAQPPEKPTGGGHF